jgi:hypothetical protein
MDLRDCYVERVVDTQMDDMVIVLGGTGYSKVMAAESAVT